MSAPFIFYQFSRDRVEQVDFSAFLALYGREHLPAGRRLREMMNTFTFVVEGYDDDPRELYTIPEVRRFYQAFRRAWPYWLYFGNLETELLRVPVLSCLHSLDTSTVRGDALSAVWFDPAEMKQFLREDLRGFSELADQAGLFEDRVVSRTHALIAYFQAPRLV